MNSFDELLNELHALENQRALTKSFDYWAPPARPRVDPRHALKVTMDKLERLTKSLAPPPTPAEKAAAERADVINRCRKQIPVILQKSLARFNAGRITGDEHRLVQARVIRLTDALSHYGIQL